MPHAQINWILTGAGAVIVMGLGWLFATGTLSAQARPRHAEPAPAVVAPTRVSLDLTADSNLTIGKAAPTFSLATLRTVLAEMQTAEPERGQRWTRAGSIVALRSIEPTPNGNYWVQSEMDPDAEYIVCWLPDFDAWGCNCKDFQQRGGPCKHGLAVRLMLACEERERGPEPPPLALPFAEADPAEAIPYVLTALGEQATREPVTAA